MAEFEYRVEIEAEDSPVRGNLVVTDDPKADKRMENRVLKRLENGDLWAWCSARVIASWNDFECESEWLGGCSYKNEADFRKGGYYDDMKREAGLALVQYLERAAIALRAITGPDEIDDEVALNRADDDREESRQLAAGVWVVTSEVYWCHPGLDGEGEPNGPPNVDYVSDLESGGDLIQIQQAFLSAELAQAEADKSNAAAELDGAVGKYHRVTQLTVRQ